MDTAELISELTDICIRQAEMIKVQAYALEMLGAEVEAEEALRLRERLREAEKLWEGKI